MCVVLMHSPSPRSPSPDSTVGLSATAGRGLLLPRAPAEGGTLDLGTGTCWLQVTGKRRGGCDSGEGGSDPLRDNPAQRVRQVSCGGRGKGLWCGCGGGHGVFVPPTSTDIHSAHIPIAFIMEGGPLLAPGLPSFRVWGSLWGSGEGVKVGQGMGMEGRDGAGGTALEGWR